MGLYVRLKARVDQIDAERWEAVWLTSLQLLEQFPGPLAAHVVDEQHERRHVLTPQTRFQVGTKKEHWKVNGDLGSRRFAETYSLYRHLAHYCQHAAPQRAGNPAEILWLPAGEMDEGEADGLSLFDAKSQGYPYHYAMLAVAILVENSFPGQAVVYGDISRTQAEQVVPWAEAILGRPLRLPVVTEGPRLWQRLAAAYAGHPVHAVRRFLRLSPEEPRHSWRVLAQLEPGPDQNVLREVYQSELAQYTSLRQRGAEELIAALCEADGGLGRVLDWVCGPDRSQPSCRFTPDDLLECLCDVLVPNPLDEREVLDVLTPPPDQLPTIETLVFQLFSALSGKPVVCSLYVNEQTILAEFTARWPEQAGRFRDLLQHCTAKTRVQLEEARARLDKRLAASPVEEDEENTGSFTALADTGVDYDPTAEFLYAEIARQRHNLRGLVEFARQVGEQMRAGLERNPAFRRDLEASGRAELIRQISLASAEHGFALRESAWQGLVQATTDELRYLTMLALIPEREVNFWDGRNHLLEAPELWPVLAGTEADP